MAFSLAELDLDLVPAVLELGAPPCRVVRAALPAHQIRLEAVARKPCCWRWLRSKPEDARTAKGDASAPAPGANIS